MNALSNCCTALPFGSSHWLEGATLLLSLLQRAGGGVSGRPPSAPVPLPGRSEGVPPPEGEPGWGGQDFEEEEHAGVAGRDGESGRAAGAPRQGEAQSPVLIPRWNRRPALPPPAYLEVPPAPLPEGDASAGPHAQPDGGPESPACEEQLVPLDLIPKWERRRAPALSAALQGGRGGARPAPGQRGPNAGQYRPPHPNRDPRGGAYRARRQRRPSAGQRRDAPSHPGRRDGLAPHGRPGFRRSHSGTCGGRLRCGGTRPLPRLLCSRRKEEEEEDEDDDDDDDEGSDEREDEEIGAEDKGEPLGEDTNCDMPNEQDAEAVCQTPIKGQQSQAPPTQAEEVTGGRQAKLNRTFSEFEISLGPINLVEEIFTQQGWSNFLPDGKCPAHEEAADQSESRVDGQTQHCQNNGQSEKVHVDRNLSEEREQSGGQSETSVMKDSQWDGRGGEPNTSKQKNGLDSASQGAPTVSNPDLPKPRSDEINNFQGSHPVQEEDQSQSSKPKAPPLDFSCITSVPLDSSVLLTRVHLGRRREHRPQDRRRERGRGGEERGRGGEDVGYWMFRDSTVEQEAAEDGRETEREREGRRSNICKIHHFAAFKGAPTAVAVAHGDRDVETSHPIWAGMLKDMDKRKQ
ncbi:hypothetical protein AAFF_G00271710 [Aldrovandia affinis]|uniref:Tankyrase 1-binding protein C-terminal domain-containing protein n=1 Tax=Aldrovandia affinis TaxID=143900 RepID=A0AAD7RAY9_9TELE|nr:hypothetical protein AAFF_G00271710 [Aldrovandia affinis]